MAFYTFCEKVGNKIYHRYVNDEGKRAQEIVTDFPIDLYIASSTGEFRDIYGTSLSRFVFDNMKDASDFKYKYKDLTDVYGQTDFVSQFLSKTYPGVISLDMSKYKVMNFDIETRHDGYDDLDEVLVRRSFAFEPETMTVAEMKKLSNVWEVYDKYNDKQYPVSDAPQWKPGGFPEARDASYEVMSISAKLFGDPNQYTFGIKDFTPTKSTQIYIKCDDEKDMLIRFVNHIRYCDPDCLTGQNIELYDIPYLINRMRNIGITDEVIARLSPFHASLSASKCIEEYVVSKVDDDRSYSIFGIQTFDLFVLYKQFILDKQESYKLDNIGEIEVGEKKVDYSEYNNSLMELFLKDYDKFVTYNEQDVALVEKIDNKRQLIRLAITTVLMTHTKYDNWSGKVKPQDDLIYNMLSDEGVVIPPMHSNSDESIEGGFVSVPVPGKFRNVVSFDFTSLYPTICRMYNMSPETLVRPQKWTTDGVKQLLAGEDLSKEFRESGLVMCANGAVFRKDIEGVLPRAMTYVFDNRKKYKKLMLQEKRNKEKYIEEGGVEGSEEYNRINDLISMYDALQGALKVLANSGYGATANCGFRYFNRSIAEGITLTGQFTIQETIAKVNLFLGKLSGIDRNRMICSDTDSSYFDISDFIEHPNDPSLFVDEMEEFCKTKLAPFIDMVQKNISNRMGCAKNLMDMKREALIGSGFWRGKKNYACLVYDMEDVRYHEPILKTVGIQTKRSDQPMVIRKELEKCILIILQETEESLQKEVVKFKKVYMGLPLHDIAKPIGISNINSTAWNSAAGRRHNQLILDLGLEKEISRIKSGSKVKVLKLKKANPLQANCFAFEGELNPKFGIDKYVDVDVMWTETFTSTLESFTKVIGQEQEKKSNLMELFA